MQAADVEESCLSLAEALCAGAVAAGFEVVGTAGALFEDVGEVELDGVGAVPVGVAEAGLWEAEGWDPGVWDADVVDVSGVDVLVPDGWLAVCAMGDAAGE